MAYLPHPKRNWTGFDAGNPDHVAALTVEKMVRTSALMYGDEVVVVLKHKDVAPWLKRAKAGAQECQADRARTLAYRRAQVEAYLAQRAERDSAKQLKMF